MSEHQEVVPIRNDGTRPLTILVEPWGIEHVVAPGQQVTVVARGPAGGSLEIERGTDTVTVYGWSESQVAVVPEPDHSQAVADMRAQGRALANDLVKAINAPVSAERDAYEAQKERENQLRLERAYIRSGQKKRSQLPVVWERDTPWAYKALVFGTEHWQLQTSDGGRHLTLLVDGDQVEELDAWPACWTKPGD